MLNKLWTTAFWTRKSMVISEASTNGIWSESLNDVRRSGRSLFDEEERLDNI